jgi:hypothetical protein
VAVPPHTFITTYPGLSNRLQNETLIAVASKLSSSTSPANPQKFQALWDTGATNTSISQRVVQQCALKPIGMTEVSTASGKHTVPTYVVDVYLPNMVRATDVLVVEGDLDSCDVLVGMDIIGKGDFAVTNYDGQTAFSFRIPSQKRINFVAELEEQVKRQDQAQRKNQSRSQAKLRRKHR